MAVFERIDERRQRLIEGQELFFDDPAAPGGLVYIAPKGMTIQHQSA